MHMITAGNRQHILSNIKMHCRFPNVHHSCGISQKNYVILLKFIFKLVWKLKVK